MMAHTIRLSVAGMSCAGCVASVEKALNGVDLVTSASVNFAEHTAEVNGSASVGDLVNAIKAAGYDAAELRGIEDEAEKESLEQAHYVKLIRQAVFAGLLGIPLFIAGMLGKLPALSSANGQLFWLVIGVLTFIMLVYSAGHFFRGAVKAFRVHNANMDTLIALGTGSAWAYSMVVTVLPDVVPTIAQHAYFEAAAIIIALINFGSAMEMRARGKTSEAIKKLIGLQPKSARVLRDGVEQDVPIESVGLDETLRIRPGEQVPVDGIIIEGSSRLDESMLTGEPMPVQKGVGEEVIAGTMNTSGSFLYQSKRIGKDTVLAKIIELVRQAQSSKPAIARLVDKVAAVFVPSVMIVAIITFLIWYNLASELGMSYAIVTTMTVLIIACPCALGLATPISIMVGVGRAASMGILIRNGDALQQVGRLTTIVLDKTGTITEGKPAVTNVDACDVSDDFVLQVAASLEQQSEHPLGSAILQAAESKSVSVLPLSAFEAVSGHGVTGLVDGNESILGNAAMMQANGVNIDSLLTKAETYASEAKTPIYLAVNNQLKGLIVVADPVKQGARQSIARMHELGLNVVMLTGDNQVTADAVAAQLNINRVVAEVLPQDKDKVVAELQAQGEVVAMVGDGINDAPALARADVGLAIGSGTDVAIESADITLMQGSLHGVVDAIALSKATVRNIKQNLFGAFFYNSIGIPIAAGVLYPFFGILLNPMIAGAAMALSSVTVVSNANRLRSFASSRDINK
jgi:Cu+-exporting ATPase